MRTLSPFYLYIFRMHSFNMTFENIKWLKNEKTHEGYD